ncbi:hypothetical protein ACQKFO_21810 [Rossellomorea sp. NPDC071047]|uniref:hypothetical protein n=1 Tax=Rossellomorea sp. NPDC071047 TaxID=3390675 RepID=UPI003D063DBC
MSKKNWHPVLKKSISAYDWYMKHNNTIPFCKVCNHQLSFVSKASSKRTMHFRHPDNSRCPTILENANLYSNLTPQLKDTSNALELKEWVKENGYLLYKQMCFILGGSMKWSEFTEILLLGKQRDIFLYSGLTTNLLPYTLLANYGIFPKIKGRTGRDFSCFMCFSPTVSSFEQLWNEPTEESSHIFRIYPKINKYEVLTIGEFPSFGNLTPPDYVQGYIDSANL